jgi:prolipoprotein diacylglyceryltransferase
LNGCCFGREADGFGTLYLPGKFGEWASRYPTQPALMVFDLLLFAWLWVRRKSKPFEGYLTISFLFWFSLGRLILDDFRDLPEQAFGLNFQQLASVVTLFCLAVGLLTYLIGRRLPARAA